MPNYQDWDCRHIEVNQIRLYRMVYIICRRIQQKWAIVLGQVLQMCVIIERLVLVFATATISPEANVALWRIAAMVDDFSDMRLGHLSPFG